MPFVVKALSFYCPKLNKGKSLFTALYLKQCSVSLQRYYAANPIKHEQTSIAVSLPRSGIRRIIPRRDRHCISVRDDRADYLVRLYLSWLGVARIIELAKPVSSETFRSITHPVDDIGSVQEVMALMKVHFKAICRKYFPWITTIPLKKGMCWEPTWKSTPNDDLVYVGR